MAVAGDARHAMEDGEREEDEDDAEEAEEENGFMDSENDQAKIKTEVLSDQGSGESGWEGQERSDTPPARRRKIRTKKSSVRTYRHVCERCHKAWPSAVVLLKHIAHIRPCRSFYGEDRLWQLQESLKHVAPRGTVTWVRGEEDALAPCETSLPEDVTSKLDSSSLSYDGSPSECLPAGYAFRSRILAMTELRTARAFVGLSVNRRERVIEARPLLSCEDINIDDFRELLHAVLAVTKVSMADLMTVETSEIGCFGSYKSISSFRDQCYKELAQSLEVPDPPPVTCSPGFTRETSFISKSENISVPAEQIVVNFDLAPVDMGAVGVIAHVGGRNRIVPLFTVNMDYWQKSVRYLQSILVNWTGSADVMAAMWLATPCGAQGARQTQYMVRKECYDEYLRPKTTKLCPVCGKCYEINPNIPVEWRNFNTHVKNHNKSCNVCGETFPSQPKLHQHKLTAHKSEHHACTVSTCKFVTNSQANLEKHVAYNHTQVVCDLCGKTYANRRKLGTHVYWTHSQARPDLVCEQCGKCNFVNVSALKAHYKYHSQKKEPNARGSEQTTVGYVCPLQHEGCKLYFKRASYLRKHISMYVQDDPELRGKELPQNQRDRTPYRIRGDKGTP